MSTIKTIVAFIVLSILWGSAFVVVRVGQMFFPPVFYAALSFSIATIGMLAGVRIYYQEWIPRTSAGMRAIGVIAILMIIIYNSLFFIGQRTTPSAVGAILLSIIPVATAVFTIFLDRDHHITARAAIGIGLGTVGVVLVVNPTPQTVVAGESFPKLLILGAACTTAFGSVLVEQLNPNEPAPVLLAWGMMFGAAGLFVMSYVVIGELPRIDWTLNGILVVLYLALIVNLCGYLLYFYLLFKVGAFETNLINYVLPVTAAIWGGIVYEEMLEPASFAGFLAIMLGFGFLKSTELQLLVQEWTSP